MIINRNSVAVYWDFQSPILLNKKFLKAVTLAVFFRDCGYTKCASVIGPSDFGRTLIIFLELLTRYSGNAVSYTHLTLPTKRIV